MAPSNYDLRNLFQINCEEGRHLWAMVHLLCAHFGKDGEREIEGLLARRSGSADNPRILNAFNHPIEEFLSFLFWSTLADRDGKYQLLALAESGFDPLSRTTRFMLTEEAHHMFVGETGVERIVARTAELMKADPDEDVTRQGGIPLDMIQRYLNLWFALSLDLFGGEISSNAASFFADGLKGRYKEETYQDHLALGDTYRMPVLAEGRLAEQEVPLRNAMNEVLRDEYVKDSERALARWNKSLADEGIAAALYLPSTRFHRHVGEYLNHDFDVRGNRITRAEFETRVDEWLPTVEDRETVRSLMIPVTEPGKIANWIAPPSAGVNNKPFDFEYVKL
jgi:benzoyl-CoA 2,3-dioxygenase component B